MGLHQSVQSTIWVSPKNGSVWRQTDQRCKMLAHQETYSGCLFWKKVHWLCQLPDWTKLADFPGCPWKDISEMLYQLFLFLVSSCAVLFLPGGLRKQLGKDGNFLCCGYQSETPRSNHSTKSSSSRPLLFITHLTQLCLMPSWKPRMKNRD